MSFAAAIERTRSATLRHLADCEITLDGLVTVPAIWREQGVAAFGMVNASAPTALIASDAYPEIRRGLRVTRNGVDWRAIDALPDGTGFTLLQLELDPLAGRCA